MIIYDAVNDGIFSAVDLVHWYNSLLPAPPVTDKQRYARMYLVPNLAHCGGGPATAIFTANMLSALTDWVEKRAAPGAIIAANKSTSSPFPSGPPFDPQVARNFPTGGTRPLCPYPQQTRYSGSGATNDAANFRCVVPGEHWNGDGPH